MLRNRNFFLLWLAQWISASGDTFTFLALAVRIDGFFTDPGDSGRALGGVLIAFALPQLLLGIFAGTLVDRWDRRRVMVVSDLARAALVPAYLLLKGPEDLPWAFGVSFVASSFSVLFYPARGALLPALVKREELMAANGWMQVGRTVGVLSGPVLAGIVVGRWGTGVAFWVDAVSFLLSALLLLGIWGVQTRATSEGHPQRAAWLDLVQGVRYVLRSRLLQGITLGLAIAMLGLGAVNVLFVPFLRHAFQAPPEALGGLQTAQGAGMFLGGLVAGALGRRLAPLRVSVAAMLLLGLGVALFGMAPGYSVALIIIPLVGLTISPLNASLQTLLQTGVPQEMLGRAGSVMDMAITVANLVSMGTAGWLGGLLGLREMFLLAGALTLVGGLAMGLVLRREVPPGRIAVEAVG